MTLRKSIPHTDEHDANCTRLENGVKLTGHLYDVTCSRCRYLLQEIYFSLYHQLVNANDCLNDCFLDVIKTKKNIADTDAARLKADFDRMNKKCQEIWELLTGRKREIGIRKNGDFTI